MALALGAHELVPVAGLRGHWSTLMHIRETLLTYAAASLGVTSAFAQEAVPAAVAEAQPTEAPAPVAEYPIEQILEVYGWFLGEQMQVFAFGMSDEEIEALSRGVALAARGQQPKVDLERIGPSLQAFLGTRPDEVFARRTEESRAEQKALFAELDARNSVQKTASGLRYEILEPGSDERPTLSDVVFANYTGTFVDGTVFDTSEDLGVPVEFELNGVIEGWQEGLQLIGTGGRIKLYIPGDLAYGDSGNRNIPPAKPLIFDVELVRVQRSPVEASQ